MKKEESLQNSSELTELCLSVKKLIEEKCFNESISLIQSSMGKYPHAPEPHNLMGIQLENQGDHLLAMKHFRAAWALDPTYIPAKYNMNQYTEMFITKRSDMYVPEDYSDNKKEELK